MNDYRIRHLRVDSLGELAILSITIEGHKTLCYEFIGGETIEEVEKAFNDKLPILNSSITELLDVLTDLSSYSNIPSEFDLTKEAWDRYKEHLKIVNFRLLIDEFKLSDQISLEEAVQVLHEYYYVMPVMSS